MLQDITRDHLGNNNTSYIPYQDLQHGPEGIRIIKFTAMERQAVFRRDKNWNRLRDDCYRDDTDGMVM